MFFSGLCENTVVQYSQLRVIDRRARENKDDLYPNLASVSLRIRSDGGGGGVTCGCYSIFSFF